jgi:membrane-associated protease RseP (regulator of RpoE activity)
MSTFVRRLKTSCFHLFLFALTLLTTTLAGAESIYAEANFFYLAEGDWFPFTIKRGKLPWEALYDGLYYSVPFLAILTAHEFGHYFTCLYYRLRVSLPYYIPFWLGFLGIPTVIGSMGAFIRIKSPLQTRKQFFDVGIAGPLAGFVVALGVLFYGFSTLPSQEYIVETSHPAWRSYYEQHGENFVNEAYKDMGFSENTLPPGQILMGTNLLFEFFKEYVTNDPKNLPDMREMMHYPWLLAGYLALFFTALNLIPIGQLDGGHILYGLVGQAHHRAISRILFTIFVGYSGLGIFSVQDSLNDLLLLGSLYLAFLFVLFERSMPSRMTALVVAVGVFTAQFVLKTLFPAWEGYNGWLLFAFLIGRFLGVEHPAAENDDAPLNRPRKILGWITLIIFILCFSPKPFIVT